MPRTADPSLLLRTTLRARFSQIFGCGLDQTAGIRSYGDHVKALPDTLSGGIAMAGDDAEREAMALRRRSDALYRRHELRFRALVARRQAKLRVQIVRSDESDIYARHAEDLIEVAQRLGALDLYDHHDLIVDRSRINGAISDAEAVGSKYAADAARALGRILRPAHRLLGLLACVYHRHNHSPCARVERPLEPLDAVTRNAHKRNTGACIRDGRDHIGDHRRILRAMLPIDHQPIEALSRHEPRERNTGNAQPRAQARLASLELRSHMIRTQISLLLSTAVCKYSWRLTAARFARKWSLRAQRRRRCARRLHFIGCAAGAQKHTH